MRRGKWREAFACLPATVGCALEGSALPTRGAGGLPFAVRASSMVAAAAMLAARDVSDARSSSTTRRCGDQHLARCDEDSRTAIGGALLQELALFYYNVYMLHVHVHLIKS